MARMIRVHFILYVEDQERSTRFYREVLGVEPRLHVPGMTEFEAAGAVIGLMPESGIERLLGDALPPPARARGIPRSELYLVVDAPREHHARAIAAGARELSGVEARDWGDAAGYVLDPDGHVLAFACPIDAGASSP
jgi:catechol 2,3-dioxygenase-like lactoylglutathione lyase family enzyme